MAPISQADTKYLMEPLSGSASTVSKNPELAQRHLLNLLTRLFPHDFQIPNSTLTLDWVGWLCIQVPAFSVKENSIEKLMTET